MCNYKLELGKQWFRELTDEQKENAFLGLLELGIRSEAVGVYKDDEITVYWTSCGDNLEDV